MEKNKIKIVFFGTPEFATASLDRLVTEGRNDGIVVAAVVTMPDKTAGRGHGLIESDVKKYAKEHDIRVLQPSNLKAPEFIEELKEINADLFVVIAFRMLPEAVWSMPPKGTFNLHASLLPKYRGAAPINRAVMNGEKETGITTFFLKHEIDTGDIIDQEKIEIKPEENAGDVHDKLMALGAVLTLKTVKEIAAGKVKSYPQPEGEFIPAPKIFKDICKIDWNHSSEKIHNQIRGLAPYPSAWAIFTDHRTGDKQNEIKIFESALTDEFNHENGEPGSVMIEKDRLLVKTGDSWIEIKSVRPAGKKMMEAAAFLRGYRPSKFM